MQPKRNIAARAGRWSAKHRKTAIIGWILFVVIAFVMGGKVGTNELSDAESGVGESGQAAKIVDASYPKNVHESILVQHEQLKTDAPAFHAAVADVIKSVEKTKGVTEIGNPYARPGPHQPGGAISPDKHSALVTFEIHGDPEDKALIARVDDMVAATKAVDRAHPGFNIEQFGDASSSKAFEDVFNSDLQKAEITSVPFTLIVLLLTFGTLLVAGMPILLAITGVVGTFGLIGPISQLAPVEGSIKNVVLLIGLAVGVDYALFYVRRVREERAAGKDSDAAIEAAAATSGRAVLVSGLTVMTSMAGMYLAGASTFTAWATGTVVVVGVAMLGSLTVLPAMLSLAGDRVTKEGRIPGLARMKRRAVKFGLWSRVTDRVLARPKLSAVVSTGILVALAIPALGMQTGEPGTETLPKDLPVVQTFKRLDKAFHSETSGMTIVVKGKDVTTSEFKAAVTKLDEQIHAQPKLFTQDQVTVDVNPDKTVATLELGIQGDGTDDLSNQALDELREDIVPATLGNVPSSDAYVTGGPAEARDFNDTLMSHLPLVFGFVLMAAFVLLLVTFRSIVIPIKAIILNLLSVGASYGMLVLVFQHGWFKSLLGFEQTGPIVPWLPLFLFVILFGLSMDYHVFILSRVKELVDRGKSTEVAVSEAIKSTAGVVTSAAIVMAGVFAIFGTLSWMMFKQMGVGLAFAVLLDATLIRGVLLPSSMKLLGKHNWWLPRRLQWLPKVSPEGAAVPAAA